MRRCSTFANYFFDKVHWIITTMFRSMLCKDFKRTGEKSWFQLKNSICEPCHLTYRKYLPLEVLNDEMPLWGKASRLSRLC